MTEREALAVLQGDDPVRAARAAAALWQMWHQSGRPELDAALLVNPHDIDSMARTIATALTMPLTERRMRWEAMMAKLRRGTIQQWFANFVEELQETQLDRSAPPLPMAERPTPWPRRPAQAGARIH